jgi:hypothetical protein
VDCNGSNHCDLNPLYTAFLSRIVSSPLHLIKCREMIASVYRSLVSLPPSLLQDKIIHNDQNNSSNMSVAPGREPSRDVLSLHRSHVSLKSSLLCWYMRGIAVPPPSQTPCRRLVLLARNLNHGFSNSSLPSQDAEAPPNPSLGAPSAVIRKAACRWWRLGLPLDH